MMFKHGAYLLVSLLMAGCVPVISQSPYVPTTSPVEPSAPQPQPRQQTTPADRYSQGLAALTGDGVPRDLNQAVFWFEQVVDTGHPQWSNMALLELARIYRGEHGPSHTNRVKAAQYLERCEAYHDARCAEQLQALELYPDVYRYRKADRFEPKPIAFTPLDVISTFALIGNDQVERALPHLEHHARQGNADAQMLLALYLLKQRDEHTFVEGMTWAYLAAEQQEPEGQYIVGSYLLELSDDNQIQAEGWRWIATASRLGLAEASYDLGMRYLSPSTSRSPQYDQARYYLSRAAEQGSVDAQVRLGDIYYEGLGVESTRDGARKFYLAAAEAGSEEAQARLRSRFGSPVTTPPAPTVMSSELVENPAGTVTRPLAPAELFRQLSPTVHVINLFEDQGGEPVLIGQGSGIAISPRMMITNAHVIEEGTIIASINIPRKEVELDKDVMLWTVISTDPERDLALLLLLTDEDHQGPLPHVTQFASLDELSIGQAVWAIGAPQGLDKSLSSGIISSFRDSDELNMGYSKTVNYIQTTASISHGSSGGGLFDAAGRLIGITSFINQGGESLNFALTMDDVLAFLHELRQDSEVSDSPRPRTHNAVRKKSERSPQYSTPYRNPLRP